MAGLNFDALGAALANFMYTDTITIISYTEQMNADGSTDPNAPVVKAKDVPCKISNPTLDVSDLGEERDATRVVVKIICAMNVPIGKGDTLHAQKRDPATGQILQELEGQAGLPAYFLVHQEVELLQEGQA